MCNTVLIISSSFVISFSIFVSPRPFFLLMCPVARYTVSRAYILHCAGLKVEQEDCNESELERVERRYLLYSLQCTMYCVFVLYLTVPYRNLLYCAVLYCFVLYSIHYCTVLHCTTRQCWGSGFSGSSCFWASSILIH
jgi:hypothetical protein